MVDLADVQIRNLIIRSRNGSGCNYKDIAANLGLWPFPINFFFFLFIYFSYYVTLEM